MRFICGKTTCGGCGRLLDVMDDTVAITPVVAAGSPWSGFFHRGCLDRLPDRTALTRRWHEYIEKLARSRSQYFPVLAASGRFLVVRRDAETKIGLYHLDWCAEQRFNPDDWEEFAGLLTGEALQEALDAAEEAEVASASERFAVKLGNNPRQARLSWSTPTGREIEYPAGAFEAYTAAKGPLNGFVDFAALAAEDGLKPSETYGDLARCQGVVVRVDSTRNGYEVVYTAQQPVAIELGHDGLAELRRVLGDLRR